MDTTTFVNIAIFSKDDAGHGVGVELTRRDSDKNYDIYCLMSLWFPKADYPSKRKVIFALFPRIFNHIPDSDELIIFRSTSEYFGYKIGEMQRKSGVYSLGRQTLFYQFNNPPGHTLCLALDAANREPKEDIIEFL